MLKLSGKVINVFKTPTGKRQDGTVYGGDYSVQLQASNILNNGETRVELVNLKTSRPKDFIAHTGKEIIVDVGAFAKNNSLVYFLPDRFEIHATPVAGQGGKL
jgi:hypothetical protein